MPHGKKLNLPQGIEEKLLRDPWITRRSNQSILKEINPEYLLEGLLLNLKLQYLGHLMWRADLLEQTLMLGRIEGKKRREWQRERWDNITISVDMNLSKLWEIVEDRGPWYAAVRGSQRVRHNLANEKQEGIILHTHQKALNGRGSWYKILIKIFV